jgi:hypothetical protein
MGEYDNDKELEHEGSASGRDAWVSSGSHGLRR